MFSDAVVCSCVYFDSPCKTDGKIDVARIARKKELQCMFFYFSVFLRR